MNTFDDSQKEANIHEVAEKICGKIFQKCDNEPKLYFRSVDVRPSALVQVENKSTCIMRAVITLGDGRVISENIEQEQQVSIDVPSIMNLQIECSGEENSFCRGLYVICLRPALIGVVPAKLTPPAK